METSDLLRALQEVEKRAERVHDDQHVINTYVEAGALVNALAARDNGIVAGRRGTGKTHALRYLAETERTKGSFVVFIDIDKDLGSTEGLYSDTSLPLSERATRLLVDVVGLIHTALLEDAFASGNDRLIETLDKMIDHFEEVVVAEQAEEERTLARETTASGSLTASAALRPAPSLEIKGSSDTGDKESEGVRRKVSGPIRHRVHFGAVGQLMQEALSRHSGSRAWVLLDEWSSLHLDVQPYLAEMLRRLFFGLASVTIRVAVIPHRTNWRASRLGDSGYIGVEVGAELFPLLDLDEFVVFPARSREEQAERAGQFFRQLLFRHLNQILSEREGELLDSPEQMVSLLFTQVTALQEMIRAAEGVPRDALTIVSRAALRAGDRKISTDHVRDAAAQVYLATKAALLNGVPAARALLDAIITEVISEKKARAFLLAPEHTEHTLIRQLVDDRILHIIKRGYSSKDEPGTRYDVLQIDYGCYVQLLRTSSAPEGLFGPDGPGDDMVLAALYSDVDVPEDDYRAIRRAVLDLPRVLQRLGENS